MFYVYSEYSSDGEHAETIEEAIKIAKNMIRSDFFPGESDTTTIEGEVTIYKRHMTVSAQTEITFSVTKEEDNDAS